MKPYVWIFVAALVVVALIFIFLACRLSKNREKLLRNLFVSIAVLCIGGVMTVLTNYFNPKPGDGDWGETPTPVASESPLIPSESPITTGTVLSESPVPLPLVHGWEHDTGYQYLRFGTNTDGTPMIWRILDVEQDTWLLFSEYVMDVRSFGDKPLWQTSDLRKWLNEQYYYEQFSPLEQKRVVDNGSGEYLTLPSVADMTNSRYGFAASKEAKDENRVATNCAKALEKDVYSGNGHSDYFTKSAVTARSCYYVRISGSIGAALSTREDLGVRPMVRIQRPQAYSGEGTLENPFRMEQ